MSLEDEHETIFSQEERSVLMIDGANHYSVNQRLDFEVDLRLLYQYFAARTRLVRALYYTAVPTDQDYSPLRPLLDWLQYNGYVAVTKPLREFVGQSGERRLKGNMDTEIAVDAMELSNHIDHLLLASGDGDFLCLIRALQRRGVRTTLVSSARTEPRILSDELRRQADHFIELADLEDLIGRRRSEEQSPNFGAPPEEF